MSADPLRYVSTTKDGALSSYTDLPVDEHTDDESHYESFDALVSGVMCSSVCASVCSAGLVGRCSELE